MYTNQIDTILWLCWLLGADTLSVSSATASSFSDKDMLNIKTLDRIAPRTDTLYRTKPPFKLVDLLCQCVRPSALNSSGPSGHSHLKKLTQLVISLPADTQHINILTLHLPEDDYEAYLSITAR